MSLITVQNALARIYTDSKLRDDFLTNPDVVGRTLRLNCVKIQQLSKLSSQEVNMFANSLKQKRLGEIRKLLPSTVKVLEGEFNKLFFQYAETYLPNKNNKHLEDAIAFTEFILNKPPEDINSSLVSDVLLYEHRRLKAIGSNKPIVFDRFNYSLQSLINNLQTANLTSTPKLAPQKNLTIWFRLTSRNKWRLITIPIINLQFLKNKIWWKNFQQVS